MSPTAPFALSMNQQLNVKKEVTFGTYVNPQPGDTAQGEGTIRVFSFNIDPTDERKERGDSRLTSRSKKERIQGKSKNSWELDIYAQTEGTPGTNQPGYGALLQAGFGGTPTPGTPSNQCTFPLGALQQQIIPLSLTTEANQVVAAALAGSIVDEIELDVKGDDEPHIKFRGFGKHFIQTGFGTVNGAVSSGASVVFDDVSMVKVGSVGAFRATEGAALNDGPSDAGFRVATVVLGTNTATFVNASDGTAASFASGQAIADDAQFVPFLANDATNANMLVCAGIDAAFTVGGVAVPITAYNWKLKNNVEMKDDTVGAREADDYIVKTRDISGTMGFRARRDLIVYWANVLEYAKPDVVITLGTGTGNRIQVTTKTEFGLSGLKFSGAMDGSEGLIELPWTAIASSSGEDETSWVYL